MKKLNRVVLVFMGIFSMILASACGDQDKAAVEKIEQTLKEKYGEEFQVEKIGGGYGTVTTNTLKAEAASKVNPAEKFEVEITKDLDKVWDSYMNVVMSNKMDKAANDMAKSVFGEDVWVKSTISSRGLSFPDENFNDQKIAIQEYLGSDSNLSTMLHVFSRKESSVDIDAEAENINRFADELINLGVKYGSVRVYYVQPGVFQDIESEYAKAKQESENGTVNKYFKAEGKSLNNSYLIIKDSKKEQTLEGIKSNFK
jgi:hypothetical protein